MPAARNPTYPAGSTLECGCGKQGSVSAINGHWARSRNPECRAAGKPIIVSAPERDDLHPAPAAAAISAVVDRATTYDADPDDDDDADEDDEAPPPHRTRTAPAPHPQLDAYADTGDPSKPPGRKSVPPTAMRPPAAKAPTRAEIAAQGAGPVPEVVRYERIDLSIEVAAIYDAVKGDPDFDFRGDMAAFLNQVVPAYFRLLGFSGIKLVRMAPSGFRSGGMALEAS